MHCENSAVPTKRWYISVARFELNPLFAPALTNLGQTLLGSGQTEEALRHCQEAARSSRTSRPCTTTWATCCEFWNGMPSAGFVFRSTALEPDLALSQAHLGLTLQCEGKLPKPLPWLKRATESEPSNALFWEWLAELYDELEEPAKSIPCWERVLSLGAECAGPHIGLGWALQQEGGLELACEHYRTALALEPDAAMAHLNLGGLYEEQGDMAAAEAAFRTALRSRDQLCRAARSAGHFVARQAARQRSGGDGGAIERRATGPGPRARLLFGLAQVLDDRAILPGPPQYLRQANVLTLELNRNRRNYAAAEHEQFVDILRAIRPRLICPPGRGGLRLPTSGFHLWFATFRVPP